MFYALICTCLIRIALLFPRWRLGKINFPCVVRCLAFQTCPNRFCLACYISMLCRIVIVMYSVYTCILMCALVLTNRAIPAIGLFLIFPCGNQREYFYRHTQVDTVFLFTVRSNFRPTWTRRLVPEPLPGDFSLWRGLNRFC